MRPGQPEFPHKHGSRKRTCCAGGINNRKGHWQRPPFPQQSVLPSIAVWRQVRLRRQQVSTALWGKREGAEAATEQTKRRGRGELLAGTSMKTWLARETTWRQPLKSAQADAKTLSLAHVQQSAIADVFSPSIMASSPRRPLWHDCSGTMRYSIGAAMAEQQNQRTSQHLRCSRSQQVRRPRLELGQIFPCTRD